MTRIIITSPSFAGDVRLLYDDAGVLLSFDRTGAELNPAQVRWMKAQAPAQLHGGPAILEELRAAYANERTVFHFADEDAHISFAQFWDRYDKKVDAGRAEAIWNRLSKADQQAAFFAIPRYFRFLAKSGFNRSKKDGKSYLNNRVWEDELK